MKIKSTKILIILVVLITLFSLTAFAYGDEANTHDIRKSTDLPLSDKEILEMVEENTPAINPKEFEEKKSDKNTLAIYGDLPEKSGAESYDWHLSLLYISKSVQNDSDFEKYRYAAGGPIFGYGATYEGGYVAIHVAFDRSEQLKEEDLEYIRSIFERHANENGIRNLPIVIECQNMGEHAVVQETSVRPIMGMKSIYTEILESIRKNLSALYNFTF